VSRLLLIGALLLSLAVPVGTAAVVVGSGSGSDQATIQMPTSAHANGNGASESVQVFDGSEVQVAPNCAAEHHLDDLKQDALAAANAMPHAKQILLDRERDFKQFLAKHPEKKLADADFATYTRLRASYKASLKVFNAQVDDFDRSGDAYNAVLDQCTMR
jgi:hypothetical protein